MTDQSKESASGGPHMPAADRSTLDAIFHHPVPHNLSWMDTLRLLTHLGSIKGQHIIFHKPHNKHLEAREVTELRHYLASAGISPRHPYGDAPAAAAERIDVVVLIDHHGAKLYRVDLDSNQRGEAVRPYDPHHFLHHLHHRDELREHGQRPAEDLTFYDKIAEALREADRIVILSHGTGESNASSILSERLKQHHPDVYARIVGQEAVNTSAMTEPEIIAYARKTLTTDPPERS
jgi:hypothetical protein